MEFSLIIAVYNIQDYISSCLESCVNQEGFEGSYEIITVNDGSTDGSLSILERYQKTYPNIKILNKPNGGLSSARNAGLEIARGDYIWFIDGDDKISRNALEIINREISMSRLDGYMINFSRFENDSDVMSVNKKWFEDSPFCPAEFMVKNKALLPMMAWLTIASNKFLKSNRLNFNESIIHEDLEFSVREFSLMRSIKYIDKPLYLYRVNRIGSIMQQKDSKRLKSLNSYVNIEKSWDEFYSEHSDLGKIKKNVMPIISEFILYDNLFKKRIVTDKKGFGKMHYIKTICMGSWKRKIKLMAFLLLPQRFFRKIFPFY